MRTRVAALFGAGVAALAIAAIGGCEAIVGDNVGGTVKCVEAPGACPSGQACVEGVCKACSGATCGQNDAGHDASHDAGVDHEVAADTTPRDDGVDANPKDGAKDTSSLLPLGANCAMSSQCGTGLCGTSTLLTSNVETPEMGSVCTKPCCTSGDCDDPTVRGFVCYPSVGGNYCVDPAWISLPAVTGMGLPGSTCGGPSDCRSSVCTGSMCQDTCCVDSDCAEPAVCQESDLDGESSFNCGLGGDLPQGGDCESDSCSSNVCISRGLFVDPYCSGACCSNADCSSLSGGGGTSCNWFELQDVDGGVTMLRGCTPALDPGEAKFGAACTSDTGCTSGLCYKKTSCTQPCCSDDDCGGTWKCSYASFSLSLLTVDLQVCVPPS